MAKRDERALRLAVPDAEGSALAGYLRLGGSLGTGLEPLSAEAGIALRSDGHVFLAVGKGVEERHGLDVALEVASGDLSTTVDGKHATTVTSGMARLEAGKGIKLTSTNRDILFEADGDVRQYQQTYWKHTTKTDIRNIIGSTSTSNILAAFKINMIYWRFDITIALALRMFSISATALDIGHTSINVSIALMSMSTGGTKAGVTFFEYKNVLLDQEFCFMKREARAHRFEDFTVSKLEMIKLLKKTDRIVELKTQGAAVDAKALLVES